MQSDFAWLESPSSVSSHPVRMSTSSLVTRNVRVSVKSRFAPERSSAAKGVWFFYYDITIANEGDDTVQLLTRHWVITDAHGETEEVNGTGVVGKQPVLGRGESFEYTSGCPLRTPFGSMQGTYEMSDEAGTRFRVEIPPFALRDPKMMQ